MKIVSLRLVLIIILCSFSLQAASAQEKEHLKKAVDSVHNPMIQKLYYSAGILITSASCAVTAGMFMKLGKGLGLGSKIGLGIIALPVGVGAIAYGYSGVKKLVGK